MPPRAAAGRRPRFTSREPEQTSTHESPNALIRPQLPPLQGTPSSRRQYTYGSGVEPPPRVSAGFQRMDISTAVNQALSKRDDTDVFVRPPKPRAATVEDEETSRDNENRLSSGGLIRGTVAGSDADSLRSFGMESDYYEDATIGSAPTLTPGPQTRQRASKPATQTQKEVPEERISQPARTGRLRRVYQSSDEDEEEEDPRTTNVVNHGKKINTPAPSRTRQTRSNQLPARNTARDESVDEEATGSKPEAESQGVHRVAAKRRPRHGSDESSEKSEGTFRRRPQHRSDKRGLFEQADKINKRITSFDKVHEIPIDPRERDSLIQQEIRDVEDQVARERAERETRTRVIVQRETWKQWFQQQIAWVLTLWPFRLFIGQRNNLDDFDDFDEDHDVPVAQWWRIFHPMTYVRTLEWLSDKLMDYIFNFINRVCGVQLRGSQTGLTMYWTMLSFLALLIGGAVIQTGMGTYVPSVPSFPNLGSSGTLPWPSSSGLFERIGNMIPSMPSWSTEEEPNIWDEPEKIGSGSFEKFLASYKKAVSTLKDKDNIHEQAIKKLEAIVPHIVHMNTKGGKPVISQEFWHALRDLIKADGSFLTFDKKKNGDLDVSSDGQWKALLARLTKDPSFTSTINNSATGAAEQVESKLSGWWDRWIKNNDNKIQELLDKAMDKRQSAGSEREFDERLTKIVNEQLKGKNQAVVSREQFLKQVESEFTKHRKEIAAEMTELRTKMDERVKEMIRAATFDAPEQVTKTEILELVHEIVKKALADLSLQAVAKGEIKVNWDAVLKNQVNFFGVGAGATIDPKRTAPVWDPWNKGVASVEAYEKGIVGVNPLPAIAALHPWQDEGDCYCGARTVNHRGNAHSASISVQLAHLMVPQQVVIEHILPGATTDPEARPRQIEVWANIEADEREKVRDFSQTHFPDNKEDWDYTPPNFEDSFVKISQFVYESDELHNGVHIHQLSPELEDLGAMTDHVIIRAVSNYGAKTHTCFYRVRLFGRRADE
ncbi:SUN domain-containing protein [Fusarium sp. LHS14.1]|nr:SUN domain-containing protein [Fusarium sp. LHS14.1]